jgi:transketolase
MMKALVVSEGGDRVETEALKAKANQLRADVLRMVNHAGSGCVGGALSMADLLTVLYYKYLRHDPRGPEWEGRDRFVLSNGHTCALLYCILADHGYFDRDELQGFRRFGGRLQGYPSIAWRVPGVETCGGVSGHGMSVALGMAMAGRLAGRDARIYCSVSDGELSTGQPWEAAIAARRDRVDNLCVLVDGNGCPIDGTMRQALDVESLAQRFRAFGWSVHEIDGHDDGQIMNAYVSFLATRGSGLPTAIVAHTVLGKGVSFMEEDPAWHHGVPTDAQLAQALQELLGETEPHPNAAPLL